MMWAGVTISRGMLTSLRACQAACNRPPGNDGPDTVRRGHYEELRCVLAVIRHGDRTPKQKMKMKVTQAGAPPAAKVADPEPAIY